MFLIFLGIVAALMAPSTYGLPQSVSNCFGPKEIRFQIPMIHENTTTFIDANVGESVQFECYASGGPGADIRIEWTKPKRIRGIYRNNDNFELPNGEASYIGNILKFPSVKPEHVGSYVCTASEENGLTTNQIYHLNIKTKPIILNTSIEKNFKEGNVLSTIRIYAKNSANPIGEVVEWYKDDQLLTNSDQFEIFISEGREISSVLITPINEDYHGIYKFLVRNEVGNATYSFNI